MLGPVLDSGTIVSRILVIAPDSDLRVSLEFALMAESHQVTCRASIGAPVLPSGYDCTVIDHQAVGPDLSKSAAFCRAFDPVVLLVNVAPHPLSPWAFRTVQKPLLGPALTGAIRDAVAVRASTR